MGKISYKAKTTSKDLNNYYTEMKYEETIEEAHRLTADFNEKHGLESDNQLKMLVAEIGELNEAFLKQDLDNVREEMGDVLFVLVSLAELEGIDLWQVWLETAKENDAKNASKEGGKVSKE